MSLSNLALGALPVYVSVNVTEIDFESFPGRIRVITRQASTFALERFRTLWHRN